jgi:hypothetical protein
LDFQDLDCTNGVVHNLPPVRSFPTNDLKATVHWSALYLSYEESEHHSFKIDMLQLPRVTENHVRTSEQADCLLQLGSTVRRSVHKAAEVVTAVGGGEQEEG